MAFEKIGRWKSGVKLSHTARGFPTLMIKTDVLMDADTFINTKVDLRVDKEKNQIAIISNGTDLKYFRVCNNSFQICSTRLSSVIKKGSGSTSAEHTIDYIEGRKAIVIQIPKRIQA